MHNRQGESFVDALFAQNKGLVAVASKGGRGGVWDEQVFSWPMDRDLLMSWADANAGGDVFICPALRRSMGRVKNDGAHLNWLWADVDYQDVPPDQRDVVAARIEKMATLVVASGSGDNVHVYVRLAETATLDVWRRLNAGLRVYLYADAKHTDNALLRLPGTINHKPQGGSVKILVPVNSKTSKAKKLLEHPVWKDILITDDRGVNDGHYSTVDVTGFLKGEVKRRVTMDSEEAVGRYGTRHGAVYQVAAWLSKKGLTADQIHSLMADFPAGVDKEETERGYSLHMDIARCLSVNPTVEVIETEDDFLEPISDEEWNQQEDDSIAIAARKRVRQMDIERLARQIDAQRMFSPPPPDASYVWSDHTSMERVPVEYAVEPIAAVGQNITITGQYKAGKTMFAINLIRSLVDADPFLGRFKVPEIPIDYRVGFWSLEMSGTDLDSYVDPIGIRAEYRLVVMSGRGYGVNIMTEVGKAWAVNWLNRYEVVTWVIDSHARLCRMSGIDENENGPVLDLLHRLDEIKEASGVGELFYLAHTGRAEQAEGRERARGATVLDDWADARWVLTREGATRFIAVEGRTVTDLEPSSLLYDVDTGRMTMGGRDKYGARTDGLVDLIHTLVMAEPGLLNTRAMIKKVREKAGTAGQNQIVDALAEAEECNFIRVEKRARGEKVYWPTTVTHDERNGQMGRNSAGATPRVMNFANAEDRPRRKGGSDGARK